MSAGATPVRVAALYCFTPMADPAAAADALRALCHDAGVRGTLLLAPEGINGTIAGPAAGIDAVVAHIRGLTAPAEGEIKFAEAAAMPFYRMKVRLKREIVTMGVPDIDPRHRVGTYVEPQDWNALIDDPDTIVIDTRNDYEIAAGTFARAIDPGTSSFREFPHWFRTHRDALLAGKKRVAMFCTGGIRCEKSTAFLRAEGVENVFHLKGGILRYLEDMPADDSRWQGDCFVFDERVAVTHGLAPGDHVLCRACRRPVSAAGRASPHYVEGVSCAACHAERDDAARARYAERARQERLAREQGRAHIGGATPARS